MSLAAGTSIGKYTVLRKIAEGGMAEIYLCSATGAEGFAKEVVIKRIRSFLATDTNFVQMFIAEARLASRLNHPNIVQIFDFDRHSDTHYLAMEYVRGASLWQVAKKCRDLMLPLPPTLIAKIGADVAAGLNYAHKLTDEQGKPLGLVHRDITPHNILLSFDGAVKVADFGIAKTGNKMSTAGMLKGKFAYMAPEQARGENTDARTDVFALGIVLWEMLTGAPLFDADSDIGVLRAVQVSEIVAPIRKNPAISPELDAVVMKALERDPALRFKSAHEMERALNRYVLNTAQDVDETDLGAFLRTLMADELNPVEPKFDPRPLDPGFMPAVMDPTAMRPKEPLPPLVGGDTVLRPRNESTPLPPVDVGLTTLPFKKGVDAQALRTELEIPASLPDGGASSGVREMPIITLPEPPPQPEPRPSGLKPVPDRPSGDKPPPKPVEPVRPPPPDPQDPKPEGWGRPNPMKWAAFAAIPVMVIAAVAAYVFSGPSEGPATVVDAGVKVTPQVDPMEELERKEAERREAAARKKAEREKAESEQAEREEAERREAEEAERKRREAEQKEHAAVKPGTLVLQATPWADVYVDGKLYKNVVGSRRVQVPAGPHKVKFVHPKKTSGELNVQVKSGRDESVSFQALD